MTKRNKTSTPPIDQDLYAHDELGVHQQKEAGSRDERQHETHRAMNGRAGENGKEPADQCEERQYPEKPGFRTMKNHK